MTDAVEIAPVHSPVQPAAPVDLHLDGWLIAGLRAAFFMPPRVAGQTPSPRQLFAITVGVFALEVALQRLSVAGDARFDLQAWLSGLYGVLVFAALMGWLLAASHASHRASLRHSFGSCMAVWLVATLPNTVLYGALMAGIAHGWVHATVFLWQTGAWAAFGVATLWSLGVSGVLAGRMAGWTWRVPVLVLMLAASTGVAAWQFTARPWLADEELDRGGEAPRLHLSQQLFEDQQALLARQLDAIRSPDGATGGGAYIPQIYGLVFAPYAEEDVFKRESALVADVLAQRFGAQGRVVQLLNHADTAQTYAWATPLNLQRALHGLAQHMNRQRDVLVVYLTSHGAQNFQLAASHWPLEVEPLTADVLRAALDAAGIRHRVIAVSACFSGGWVDVLANPDTLVMTAADATHTSYGCGRLSELTFFGRALFDEQLRRSHSFDQAFAAAVPVIRQREIDAGKPDGFSNPQIRMGADIAPVLKALAARLDAVKSTALSLPADKVR